MTEVINVASETRINVTLNFAHGVTYQFIAINAVDKSLFENWIHRTVPVDGTFDPLLVYTYRNTTYYLDRDFFCGGSIGATIGRRIVEE